VFALEPLLNGVELAVLGEALDGRDVGAVGLYRQLGTGLDGLAVYPDRTGPTEAALAADVRAGVPEVVPQGVYQ
jgi:hypothetical protein